MLGLHYCPKLSLGAVSGWVFFVSVLRRLTAVAWVLQAHGLAELGPPGTWASVAVVCGLHSCGSQALELGLSSCFAWA